MTHSHTFTVFKGSSSGAIVEAHTTKPELKGTEIYLEITHSGICGTDAHFRGVDQGLGHEGVGIVREIGKDVTSFKVGDRAGWGYVNDTCGICEYCIQGEWIYCTSTTSKAIYGYGDSTQGSYATGAVWKEDFLMKVPDGLASDVAAPLFCAGSTVWAVLSQNGVKCTDVVGVVGIGGLGHLAVQFAAKMGCEVVAISSSDSKKDEALKLGATHFLATAGKKKLDIGKKINHLIVTTSKLPDWDLYADILAPMASIYPQSITDGNKKLEIPFMRFLLQGWKFIGSTVPPKHVYLEMLNFAALHGVKPVIEKFPMTRQGVEDGLKKLDEGMRYRGVLYADAA